MSEEKEQKKLKDYSGLVSSTVPPLVQATKQNPALLSDTLQQLLAIEKKTRLAADFQSSVTVVNAILDLCHDCKDWKALSEQITLLCKRRAQLKKVHEVIIQRATAWVDETPDEATKRDLIDVLRTVSAGKMFVELERGRLTRTLASLEERAGKTALAADILQEVQVETIGAMQIREKVDFLLEQVRLCLAKNDYVRAEIISKKIAPKTLEAEDMQDLKLRYYRLMIQFHEHNGSYLAICRCYKAIYDTPQVQADPAQWREALKNFVIFLVLSPFDAEVSDLLHRIKVDKKVQEAPVLKLVLELFTTDELMAWPLQSDGEWKRDAIFQGDAGRNKYNDLRKRVVQHNIRTIAKYYSRITTARLCALIAQPAEIAEEYISELVSSGQLYARIDRPAGTVSFTRKETAHSALNTWSADISELLTLVEKTNHLITKEYMLRDNGRKQAD